jgi:cation diffusion facilitator family transporter
MTKIRAHELEHDHDHYDHVHAHEIEHEHADDHHHGHEHSSSVWATIASALHLPGYSHQHASPASEGGFLDNALAIRTVWLALLALGITAVIQIGIYLASRSVALLGDTVHNLGDALNSVPLLFAFMLAQKRPNKRYTYGYGRAEDLAGLVIVVSIGFSAVYILWESVQKLINPQPLANLGWVAAASIVGFLGNEFVALLQIRVGRKIGSEAMIADGLHARTDGLTSLAVLIAAGGAALGYPIVDPIVGILIGVVIVFVTRDAAVSIWHRLMDAIDPNRVEQARAKISEHTQIKAIHRLQMRYIGHHLFVEALLAVDPALTVAESEKLTDHISHELYHILPNMADVTIGIVPWSSEGQKLLWKESAHHREPQARTE